MVALVKSAELGGNRAFDDSWWRKFQDSWAKVDAGQRFHDGYDNSRLSELEKGALSATQQLALAGMRVAIDNTFLSGLEEDDPLRRHSSRRKMQEATTSSIDHLLSEGLSAAIHRYEEACSSGKDDGPFLIAAKVPFFSFERWYKKQESCWRIAFQFTDCYQGTALLFGDPSYLHESVAGWITGKITEDAILLSGGRVMHLLEVLGSSRIILPAGTHKEPDLCIQPRPFKCTLPPFVVEVAYANESLTVLKEELVQWTLAGGAQIGYGVKLKVDGGNMKLRFLEARQGTQGFVRDIDFSTGVCNAGGDPKFQVNFPLRTIFEGATNDQRLLEGVVVLDLFELQGRLLALLQNDTVDFFWHPKFKGSGDKFPLLKPLKKVMKRRGLLRKAVHKIGKVLKR